MLSFRPGLGSPGKGYNFLRPTKEGPGLPASQAGLDPGPLPRNVLLTVDGVSFYQPFAFISHDHAVRIAKADEVAPEDGDPSAADVHTSPLILTDDVF